MVTIKPQKYLVVGGAGFIGSNYVENLVDNKNEVVVIDNLISGDKKFLLPYSNNDKVTLIFDDIKHWQKYRVELEDVDVVIHLASNADISAAINDPEVDFRRGTVVTQIVAEMCRKLKITKIVYASGSGVYGDHGSNCLIEGITELLPNSPYGASKLGGEAILCAYSQMFNIQVFCFRFANVVGKNQTHGVGLDFLKKLKQNKGTLAILGNGTQSKSYVHVQEIVSAINFVVENIKEKYFVCNISSNDRIAVSRIAQLAIETAGLQEEDVKISYGIENKGWAGDVPVVVLSSERLEKIGWVSKMNSEQAMKKSLESLWVQISA